jgi:hypothetical protein
MKEGGLEWGKGLGWGRVGYRMRERARLGWGREGLVWKEGLG